MYGEAQRQRAGWRKGRPHRIEGRHRGRGRRRKGKVAHVVDLHGDGPPRLNVLEAGSVPRLPTVLFGYRKVELENERQQLVPGVWVVRLGMKAFDGSARHQLAVGSDD